MTEPTQPVPPDDPTPETTPEIAPAQPAPESRTFTVTFGGAPARNTMALRGDGLLTVEDGAIIIEAEQRPPDAPARRIRFMFSLEELTGLAAHEGALVFQVRPHDQPDQIFSICVYVASEADGRDLLVLLRAHLGAPQQPEEHSDFDEFFSRLRAAPIVVTQALLAANIGVFIMMALSGVGIANPDGVGLIRWGAQVNKMVSQGQWWRLLTPMFIHIGLIHLVFNMWALRALGDFVERVFGPVRFFAVYLVAGIAGNVASYFWNPGGVSAGASGAIFGLMGALVAFIYRRGHVIPREALAGLRRNAFTFILLNLAFGFSVPYIDNAAHLGGLFGGFVMGWLLARPLPDTPSPIPPGSPAGRVIVVLLAVTMAGLMVFARVFGGGY